MKFSSWFSAVTVPIEKLVICVLVLIKCLLFCVGSIMELIGYFQRG